MYGIVALRRRMRATGASRAEYLLEAGIELLLLVRLDLAEDVPVREHLVRREDERVVGELRVLLREDGLHALDRRQVIDVSRDLRLLDRVVDPVHHQLRRVTLRGPDRALRLVRP